MITLSETRKYAREHLKNKWGKGALIFLCYFIVQLIISIISEVFIKYKVASLLFGIAQILISVPISYGLLISFIKLKRDEEINNFDFLKIGFNNFAKAWKVTLMIFVRIIIPYFLCVIAYSIIIGMIIYLVMAQTVITAGWVSLILILTILAILATIYMISVALNYEFAFCVTYDNPEMKTNEIVLESKRLISGYRWKYVLLGLSFIGWMILATLSLGIGLFWLMPYIMVAEICFYDKLKEEKLKKIE